jgi:hypothetical protein
MKVRRVGWCMRHETYEIIFFVILLHISCREWIQIELYSQGTIVCNGTKKGSGLHQPTPRVIFQPSLCMSLTTYLWMKYIIIVTALQ